MNLILAVLITLGFVGAWHRIQYWKGQHETLSNQYTQVLNALLVAEKGKTQSETEHNFLKQTVIQLLQRPVQVLMNDEQFQALLAQIHMMMEAASTSADEMN